MKTEKRKRKPRAKKIVLRTKQKKFLALLKTYCTISDVKSGTKTGLCPRDLWNRFNPLVDREEGIEMLHDFTKLGLYDYGSDVELGWLTDKAMELKVGTA